MAECKNKGFFDAYYLDNNRTRTAKKEEPGHIPQALFSNLYTRGSHHLMHKDSPIWLIFKKQLFFCLPDLTDLTHLLNQDIKYLGLLHGSIDYIVLLPPGL